MKPLPEVEQKVAELMHEYFINQRALKMLLASWVDKKLIPNLIEIGVLTEPPSQYSRAYYTTKQISG